MIDAALGCIAGQLNQALRRSWRSGEDLVVLANLHEQDGSVPPQVTDKLVLSLVGIERDTVPAPLPRASLGPGRVPQAPPPLHLNLLLLLAASYGSGNYLQALKALSGAIGFFQGRPVFEPANTPELDPRIERLTLEIENLSLTDLSNLWGVLSGKYLPSVLYRVRLLTIDGAQTSGQLPTVARTSTGLQA